MQDYCLGGEGRPRYRRAVSGPRIGQGQHEQTHQPTVEATETVPTDRSTPSQRHIQWVRF